jgi:hypothetical protein
MLALVLLGAGTPGLAADAPSACSDAESAAADKYASAVKVLPGSWQEVYDNFRRFRHCDEDDVADKFAADVTTMLDKHWDLLPDLLKLTKSDAAFRSFVLNHIDASDYDEVLEGIADRARKSCPAGAKDFCADLAKAAERALNPEQK